jgi:hypothetical protein
MLQIYKNTPIYQNKNRKIVASFRNSLPSSLTNRFGDVRDGGRVDGRDKGEMTGGFKGGMKILKPH